MPLIKTKTKEMNAEGVLAKKYLQGIYNSIHSSNFCHLSMSVGRHRAGKSLFAVLMGCLLDSTFQKNFERRVVYDPRSFMKALEHAKNNNQKGAVIIWDEAGFGLPSREWYDISNKSISMALQVFGYINPIIFFVSPNITFIDPQARRLLQTIYELNRFSNDYATVRPYNIRLNQRSGKEYYKQPRIIYNHEHFILRRIKVGLPPDEIIKRYNAHSHPWKDKVLKSMKSRTRELGGDNYAPQTYAEIKEKLGNEWKAYQGSRSRPGNPQLDLDLIRVDFALNRGLAKRLKRDIEEEIKANASNNSNPRE